MTGSWPWPGDSREDRAKRVALSYRTALLNHAPEAAETLDEHWISLEQGWVRPTNQPLRLDDWLTEAEMADLLSISPKGVYMLGHRQRVRVHTVNGVRLYCVADIVEYHQKRRLWRARKGTQHT